VLDERPAVAVCGPLLIVEFRLTWDHVLAGWPPYLQQGGIDRAQGNRAFARLRSFFGDDPMALPGPVFGSLTNVVPQSFDWIVWFADCLDRFSSALGYDLLCADLRDANRHDAAVTVVQIADRMQAVGLEVAFDPSILIEGSRKVPDLLLRDRTTSASFTPKPRSCSARSAASRHPVISEGIPISVDGYPEQVRRVACVLTATLRLVTRMLILVANSPATAVTCKLPLERGRWGKTGRRP